MKLSKSPKDRMIDSLREWNSKRKKKSIDIVDRKKMLTISTSDVERLICCVAVLRQWVRALLWLKQRNLQKMGQSKHMTC